MKVTAGLIVAGVVLFGASLAHPFHFDDVLITSDSNVTNPARWVHFLNPFHLRQFTFFTFYLNHLVGGLNPAGYHAVNVAIHIANSVLLYWLLRRFVDHWIAVLAAAIFLAHPIQTEPVLYVYQRSTLLACLFSLAGLIALSKRRIAWAALAFLVAFESKESALAAPLAVALLSTRRQWRELVPPLRDDAKRSISWYWLGAAAVALAIFAFVLLLDEKTVGFGAYASPLRYLQTQTRVVFTYLRLLVFPYPQSLEYDFHDAGGVLTAAGVVVILAAGWFLQSLSALAFFIFLLPTSSFIPSADAAFEHRLYLPMLAFSLFAAYWMSKLPKRTWAAVALVAVLAGMTVRREMVWSSAINLWEDTVQRAPGKARAWFNLGGAYLNSNPDKARGAFLRALELQPQFPQALYDLGLIEQGKGNWGGALAYYERTLVQNPAYWPAVNNMGNTLFAMGQHARSVDYFERTLRLNPDYWAAHYNIAIVHFMGGRYNDAVPRLKTVLDWRPDWREARYLLAMSFARSGDRISAEQEWAKIGGTIAAESRHTPTMILAPSHP